MPLLGAGHVAVCSLQQLEDDVFDIFAHVAGLGEGGGVDDGKGDVKHLGQGLCEQCFARSSGADEQDVRLRELDIVAANVLFIWMRL